ncbi:MAG TPA: hypothetical protein VKG25_05640 [Bryobacteraceae bacterium]|nr:hypothetical protein [Bryobacteraceae bacterium]
MPRVSRLTQEQSSAEFQALKQCLLADHQPATPAEALLVHKMTLTYWRIEQMRRGQERAFESPQMVELLERSIVRGQRRYFKLLETLKSLQRARIARFKRGFVLQKAAEAA